MERQIIVRGMSCQHCEQAVKKALESIPGIRDVRADHITGQVTFQATAEIDDHVITQAVKRAGYEVG